MGVFKRKKNKGPKFRDIFRIRRPYLSPFHPAFSYWGHTRPSTFLLIWKSCTFHLASTFLLQRRPYLLPWLSTFLIMRPSNFSPANHPFLKQRQIYFSPDCHTVSWWGAMTAILSPSEATIFFTWPPSFLILRSRFHLAVILSPTQRNVPCIQLPTS